MLSSAQAASVFATKEYNGDRAIYFAGEIRQGDAQKLERVIEANPKIKTVVMWSNGGVAAEGPRVGSVLSDHNMKAVVKEGTWCMSACAEAFIGAAEYDIDGGVLGFHKAWIPHVYRHRIGTQEAFDNGQIHGAFSAKWLLANGFSFSMVDAINYFTGPETFLVFFSEDSLRKFYVRDEDNNINDYLVHTGPNEQDLMDFYIYDVDRLLHVTGNK